MHPRRALALAAALCTLLAAVRARAWQEAHEEGHDVEVRVEPNGAAVVRHRIRWRVVRGPLKGIDLLGVDPAASLEPQVPVLADDGRALTARLSRRDDGSLHVALDDPRTAMRGTFVFEVRLHVDLVSSRALVRDGVVWRLTWAGPRASSGLDGARTVFDLPAAPDPPRPILENGALDELAASSLRRDPARDILELVRPHVAKGEAVNWTLRVDPRALPGVADPRPQTADGLASTSAPGGLGPFSRIALLATVALAFGWLADRKTRAFAIECHERGVRPRGLLPLPDGARCGLAGGALAAGLGLQLAGEPIGGGALVALAALAAALRPSLEAAPARGPGRWLVLRPADAFDVDPARRGHWLDVGTGRGRAVALVLLALAAAVATAAQRLAPDARWWLAIDLGALFPLLVTGTRGQLPPDGARAAAPVLAPIFHRLKAVESLRIVPSARVASHGSVADELRLLVLPRAAMPGVLGIEVGLAWSSTPAGWVASPEVLVRVLEASAAEAHIAQTIRPARRLPGRRPDERVARLVPRGPGRASMVALTRAVVEMLTDRRKPVAAASWTAPERRVERPSSRRRSPEPAAAGTC